MKQLTTIIDKCWLQAVCKNEENAKRVLGRLSEHCLPVVPVVLIEEVLANRFQADKDQGIVDRMIRAILSWELAWMNHPAELAYQELVTAEPVASWILPPLLMQRYYRALAHCSDSEIGELIDRRFEEKNIRRDARKTLQGEFKKLTQGRGKIAKRFMHPTDLGTFARNSASFLEMVLNSPSTRTVALEGWLGEVLMRWHPNETTTIEGLLGQLDYAALLKRPATHGYLLAELLYDLGPITQVGPNRKGTADPLVLAGSKINHEEDQEYVASALHCDKLLTCDKGMQRMAEAMCAGGFWRGRSVWVATERVEYTDDYFFQS